MKSIIYIVLSTVLLFPFKLSAQNVNHTPGWAALFYSYKFSDKIGAHFDFQIRSSNEFDYLRSTIVRPGITWFIDKSKIATLGYGLIHTNQPFGSSFPLENLTEHRIWEQFIYNQKIGKLTIAHRFRLEQRFIENNINNVFSNRLRYFVRSVIPLKKHENGFNEGFFAALQNEVFLNLQNKDNLNGHVFDQNRAYVAVGYRFNPKIDIEAGYLNQAINGPAVNTTNNVIQLAFYTRF